MFRNILKTGLLARLLTLAAIINASLVFSIESANASLSEFRFIPGFEGESRLELRTAPVALFAQWYTLDVAYSPNSSKWSTGPSAILFNCDGPAGSFTPCYKGYALGWNANYYITSALDNSWYLSGHILSESFEKRRHAEITVDEMKGWRANVAAGYQWRINSLSILTGIGGEMSRQDVVRRGQKDVEPKEFDLGPTTRPYVEFKIGMEI